MHKKVKKRPVLVKSSNFEPKNYISIREFHEQQNLQLKTIINRANKRVSLFQIKRFVLAVQFSNKNQTNSATKTKPLCCTWLIETDQNLQNGQNNVAVCYKVVIR